MPFSFYAPPTLTANQVNPLHAALQDAMQNVATGTDIYSKMIKAKYMPLTTQAEAASKLAYANLMAPQFLSKLIANQDIWANIPEDQRKNILPFLVGAGLGKGTGASLLSGNIPNTSFNINQGSPVLSNQNPSEQSSSIPEYSQSYQNTPSSTVTNAVSAYLKSDEAKQQEQKQGFVNIPKQDQLMNWYNNRPEQTTVEKAAQYKGVQEEGKELGKERAQDINDLSNTVFSTESRLNTLNEVGKILTSPTFEQIRKLPILGKHEIAYYAKFGTPEQQEVAGKYINLTGNIVRDAAQDYKGAFRRGEQQLIEASKMGASDTVDSAKGKWQGMVMILRLLQERSRRTAQLMQKYHMSKLDAEDIADRDINANAIRQQAESLIYPKPTQEDIDFMAQKYNISPQEVVKRLKKRGKL